MSFLDRLSMDEVPADVGCVKEKDVAPVSAVAAASSMYSGPSA